MLPSRLSFFDIYLHVITLPKTKNLHADVNVVPTLEAQWRLARPAGIKATPAAIPCRDANIISSRENGMFSKATCGVVLGVSVLQRIRSIQRTTRHSVTPHGKVSFMHVVV
jgi:hypothetical protein